MAPSRETLAQHLPGDYIPSSGPPGPDRLVSTASWGLYYSYGISRDTVFNISRCLLVLFLLLAEVILLVLMMGIPYWLYITHKHHKQAPITEPSGSQVGWLRAPSTPSHSKE
ncbi:hypothetical protein P691DRAFT_297272 [Macrolepiota fuliginosa MF-IS2]|uniref:Uncharacterized protein n=1 Tax=Macrolepiota fuliginosa MF-IS2 TaxID=1400762 RepID=A0A9P6C144_9AGAR|nr:hypothetical protein P691DRAFT_297272 [Macrolepiota fuliginosa MF-IS2]